MQPRTHSTAAASSPLGTTSMMTYRQLSSTKHCLYCTTFGWCSEASSRTSFTATHLRARGTGAGVLGPEAHACEETLSMSAPAAAVQRTRGTSHVGGHAAMLVQAGKQRGHAVPVKTAAPRRRTHFSVSDSSAISVRLRA